MSFVRSLVLPPLLGLLWFCGGGSSPDVAATVNGYRITHEELEKQYQRQLATLNENPTEDQAKMLRLTVLREVIDRQIMLQRAEKLGLMAVDTEVDAKLQEFKSPFSEEEFQERLNAQKLTADELKAQIRHELTLEKLFNREIRSKITIAEAEMRAFYEENKVRFNVPEQQYHLAQILVTAVPDAELTNLGNDDATTDELARRKIDMIRQRLADGEDFSALAQNLSEDAGSTANGGDLGFIPQSQLSGVDDMTLRRVVASLSAGDVSPVIKSGTQYRILKLISREPAGQREYSDPKVQQSIRETLTNRKDQLLKTAYYEAARNESKIENFLAESVVRSFGASD